MGLVALVQKYKKNNCHSLFHPYLYDYSLGASFYSLHYFTFFHAFKSLLFLCQLNNIECHLARYYKNWLLKITPHIAIFVISALVLIGFPLTSGFFKDLIII